MGFLKNLFGSSRPSEPGPDAFVDVPHHMYFVVGDLRVRGEWHQTPRSDDGIFSQGYALIGPRGGYSGIYDDDVPTAYDRAGLRTANVAGVTHQPKSLQLTDFVPSHRVHLVPEPNNRYDKNALGVWNDARTAQLGYLPAEIALMLATFGQTCEAYVLREYREKRSNRRVAVKLVFAPLLALDIPDD